MDPARDSRRRVALCVDDFGLHAGVNAAVLRLAALQRLNAVSCMVGGPAWAHGARALAALDPQRIDVGLHLDLTELPLDPGLRQTLPRLLAAAYARRLNPALLRAEITAQLDAFEHASGRAPDYVDGHQHVHQLPVVREVLLEVLQRRYANRLPWLRSTRRATAGDGAAVAEASGRAFRAKAWLIETLGARALRRQAQRLGHGLNAHLLGVHDFRSDTTRYRELLRGWFGIAADGDLLMCHPAAPCPDVSDPLLASRNCEFEVLCSAGFGAALEAAGVRLQPISRILAQPALS